MKKSQLAIIVTIGIAILAFLILNSLLAYGKGEDVLADSRSVAHSNEILLKLNAIESYLLEAETSQRGFLLTQNPEYLGRYQELGPLVRNEVRQLRELTSDNAAQQGVLDHLQESSERKFDEMQVVLNAAKTDGFAAAQERVKRNIGKRYMDDFRQYAKQMRDRAFALLQERRMATQESAKSAAISLWGGTAIALLILSGAIFFVIRFLNNQELARRTEASHRAQLETEIEKRNELETEREKLIDELQRSNRELQDFAFVASHDLQEPLRKIQAFGDRLKVKAGDSLNEDARGYLTTMLGAAVRMQTLINDLLNLSRITTKAQPFVSVDLDRIAREVIEDLHTRLEDSGGDINLDQLGTIKADPLQMRQLFQNLLSNALKFSKPGEKPLITVTKLATPTHIGFAVKDNGIGFDQRHAEKVFTVFQRLHGRGEYEGTGVGLAICRKIVERHQGTIEATSTPGEGATFAVLFPRKRYEKG